MRTCRWIATAAALALGQLPVPYGAARAAFGDAALIADPLYPSEWQLHNTGQQFPPGCTSCQQGTPDADVDWAETYDTGFTGQGVVIALGTPLTTPTPGTTVKCLNAEISGRLWVGPGGINGRNFFPPAGSNVCVNEATSNHDTSVAQIAMGPVNAQQMVGAAPEAELMLLVAIVNDPGNALYDESGEQANFFLKTVLPWAETNGARVLFIPYTGLDPAAQSTPQTCAQFSSTVVSGTGGKTRSQLLAQSDVLVVWGCPTGNQWPACDPSGLALGGTDESDLNVVTSCSMPSGSLDFAAPASRSWVDGLEDLSWAIGLVGGAAAVLFEEDPSQTPLDVFNRLKFTADKVGPYAYVGGRNDQYGNGRVNLLRALLLGDVDGDGVDGDGNGSWIPGDIPCSNSSAFCDDNCVYEPNPTQIDSGRLGALGPTDGVGDPCQCGDVTGDGAVLAQDVTDIRETLADIGPPLVAPDKCNVYGPPGAAASECDLVDAVVIERRLGGAPTPALEPICGPALP